MSTQKTYKQRRLEAKLIKKVLEQLFETQNTHELIGLVYGSPDEIGPRRNQSLYLIKATSLQERDYRTMFYGPMAGTYTITINGDVLDIKLLDKDIINHVEGDQKS